ncbi:hypothetical protein GOARA_061_00790 [Gordonia araii NBRC 100433]|uniref:Uncharacterized protein n=1 Tax=Gordonia araii NBRC 100433 TaxID=1073574 RepID=G7H465_9ACTN|nr:hypothetical protein GOARA_061_00790 [Gordonia araii NBRC 100433]
MQDSKIHGAIVAGQRLGPAGFVDARCGSRVIEPNDGDQTPAVPAHPDRWAAEPVRVDAIVGVEGAR